MAARHVLVIFMAAALAAPREARAQDPRPGVKLSSFARQAEQGFAIVALDLQALRSLHRGSEIADAVVGIAVGQNRGACKKYHAFVRQVIDLNRVSLMLYDQAMDWPGAGEWILFGDLDANRVAEGFLKAGLKEFEVQQLFPDAALVGGRYLGEPIEGNSLKVVVTPKFVVLGNDAFDWYRQYKQGPMADQTPANVEVCRGVAETAPIRVAARWRWEAGTAQGSLALSILPDEDGYAIQGQARILPRPLGRALGRWIPNLRGKIELNLESLQGPFDWLPLATDLTGTVSVDARQDPSLSFEVQLRVGSPDGFLELARHFEALAGASTGRGSPEDIPYLRHWLEEPDFRRIAARGLAALNDTETPQRMKSRLGDPDPERRVQAIEILEAMKVRDALEELERLAEEDRSEAVRRAAKRAAESLKRVVAEPAASLTLAGLVPTQQQTEPVDVSQDLRALAERVDRVHRGETAGRDIPGFSAKLILEPLARDAEQRAEASIDIRFLEFQKPGGENRTAVIHYELLGTSQPVVRARDPNGRYWGIIDNKVTTLHGKDTENDQKAVKRDLRLAQQMLRFLDPAAVLRSLRGPGEVNEEDLKMGLTDPIPCLTVTGTAESFPLRIHDDEERGVRLKIFVEKATGQLIGVEACPLGPSDQPIVARREFIRLSAHDPYDGVLLPAHIKHFLVDPAGNRSAQLLVTLITINLNAKLKPADFVRP